MVTANQQASFNGSSTRLSKSPIAFLVSISAKNLVQQQSPSLLWTRNHPAIVHFFPSGTRDKRLNSLSPSSRALWSRSLQALSKTKSFLAVEIEIIISSGSLPRNLL